MTQENNHCYHCGELVPKNSHFQIEILGLKRNMCCPGCEAVAATIVENGLTNYYQYRTSSATKAEIVPPLLKSLLPYDDEDIQQDFVIDNLQLHKEISLSIEHLTCAACAWLIEKKLKTEVGVISIQVNTTTNRARLIWDPKQTKLSQLLTVIHQLGYNASPFEIDKQEQQYHKAMKSYLYKLGIAGIATMQVMMLAIALYFEVFGDLDETFRNYLRWISLIFATPVLLYSSLPFYINALRSLKGMTLSMDVPVSLALLFAYIASIYATIMGKGDVFFESISMFSFFLLLGRYLEMKARHKAVSASANLLKLIPNMATLASGEQIPAKKLIIGDVVTILPGEVLPADGRIKNGTTTINEAMLTGESLPIVRTIGDDVFAGTINGDVNITIEITKEKNNSLVANITRLQDDALYSKPRIAELSDHIARYFVAAVLIIAFLTWVYWHQYDSDNAFWIMLAVLVATCPCALSLATPTAITCSTSSLNRLGILVRRGNLLETFCKVNHVIIDKTGTLTEGNIKIVNTVTFGHYTKEQALCYAAELERYANHPIAHAFISYRSEKILFTQVKNIIGSGLVGSFNDEQWKIGKRNFVINNDKHITNDDQYSIFLSCNGILVAAFQLNDPLRVDSPLFIQELKQHNINITMLTGDNSVNATLIAKQLGVDNVISNMTPEGKLTYLRQLKKNDITLMIGDGVNDAPVLAGAHLSIALSCGTDIAKSSADMVLLGEKLQPILAARNVALKTRKIIIENLMWALGYNIIILPLAVSGLVAPYIAVIGMSLSSIIVVSNSLRLLK